MRVHDAIRSAVAALAVTSVVALGFPGTAVASTPYTTTIVSPAMFSTVTGDVLVSVTSTAPMVLFTAPGEALGTGTRVPVVSGSASFVWSSDGYMLENYMTVSNCDDQGDCSSETAAWVALEVQNDKPVLTTPTSDAVVGSSTTLTATLPDASPDGGVRFSVDDVTVGFDGTAPFAVPVSNLAEGAHYAEARMCNSSGTVCNGIGAGYASFTVQVLHPSITSLAPTPVSPNGDGRSDTTTVTYSLPNPEAVSYSIVTSPSGSIVHTPVSLGIPSAGAHSFVWNGTDTLGHRVGDGLYTIQLHTYRHLAGAEIATGVATHDIRVDDTAPELTNLAGAGATFNPKPDGFRDSWAPHVLVNESATVFLEIANSHGALMRRMSVYHSGVGTVWINWNGRATNGAMVTAGTYTFRFWAQDTAGNRRYTSSYPVHVSAA